MLENYLNEQTFGDLSTKRESNIITAVADHFDDKFGVTVKNVGDLFQFKYNIKAKWGEAITHECRGVIMRLDFTNEKWHCVSPDVEYMPIEADLKVNEHPVRYYLNNSKVRAKIVALLKERVNNEQH